jgi:hypothetical protein
MSSRWKLILLLLLLVLVFWWYRSSKSSEPDEKLVGHLDHLCQIAADNIDTPDRGVQKYFAYLGKHSPDMLKQFGATLVAVERISDDRAHDDRARRARDRLNTSLRRCEHTYQRFAEAIENDPAASRRVARGAERFGRTLEIIFGPEQARAMIPWWVQRRLRELQH